METAPAIAGDVLRAAREAAGLTQHELAHRIGVVGGERVSMWERGVARPRSPQILRAVADAVDLPPVALLMPPAQGPTIRWYRFAAGLSVDQLARIAHVSAPTLRRWESQGPRRSMSEATARLIGDALGVSAAEVVAAFQR
ncbi:hypothetical protein Cch01nite_18690 [Cellulomonas chitinilytica]|uniref:HTH cro/C1-type domain-containing protein n=1 Tax=Cellulomonas chitinilytica TaxID=398759 RepID=A0A919P1X1_9CELL|nr:hypothetical protein Cch01nite_18690 [Cellulomonas chitinilytica]